MNEKIIEIARKEVGVREEGGNNNGKRIREYQGATELQPAAWPWCAAWVDWIIREWLKDAEVLRWLNLKKMTPEQWRPKTALAYGFKNWAQARPNTTLILDETHPANPADIVTFDFSHVGLVLEDDGKGYITTLEGNTNGRGERDSESGDGVWQKVRKKTLARNFIRIKQNAI